jgi:phytol kinase
MHYLNLTIAGLAGLVTLLIAEFGYKRTWWHGEGARKFVHMLVALQAAFWPLFLDWNEVRLISIGLTIGFVISMKLRLFQSLGSVARLTYGEVFFALIIGALTLVTSSKGIYAAAILHLGFADGLAALIGLRYGRTTTYHIFNHRKSLVGTTTFFITSLAILVGFSLLSSAGLSWQYIVLGSAIATLLENIGVIGLDNLLVPAWIVLLLTVNL